MSWVPREVRRGKGEPKFRILLVDDSRESDQAIELLMDLGWSFTIENYTELGYPRQLPAIKTEFGLIIGLDAIRSCRKEEELMFKV